MYCFFFFKQKTAYEIGTGDWSSDVCSSDLYGQIKSRQHSAFSIAILNTRMFEIYTFYNVIKVKKQKTWCIFVRWLHGGNRYIIMIFCNDIFSYFRFVWLSPLPNKTSLAVCDALTALFCQLALAPLSIQCDNGAEFSDACFMWVSWVIVSWN